MRPEAEKKYECCDFFLGILKLFVTENMHFNVNVICHFQPFLLSKGKLSRMYEKKIEKKGSEKKKHKICIISTYF